MNLFAWYILKFHFCSEIYERSYQISKIEISVTFERNQILTFCKKQWFKLIEIFKSKQSSFSDPWPPYRLNILFWFTREGGPGISTKTFLRNGKLWSWAVSTLTIMHLIWSAQVCRIKIDSVKFVIKNNHQLLFNLFRILTGNSWPWNTAGVDRKSSAIN